MTCDSPSRLLVVLAFPEHTSGVGVLLSSFLTPAGRKTAFEAPAFEFLAYGSSSAPAEKHRV
jgi:hypothetical protein